MIEAYQHGSFAKRDIVIIDNKDSKGKRDLVIFRRTASLNNQ